MASSATWRRRRSRLRASAVIVNVFPRKIQTLASAWRMIHMYNKCFEKEKTDQQSETGEGRARTLERSERHRVVGRAAKQRSVTHKTKRQNKLQAVRQTESFSTIDAVGKQNNERNPRRQLGAILFCCTTTEGSGTSFKQRKDTVRLHG